VPVAIETPPSRTLYVSSAGGLNQPLPA